jgi:hypothetical protein
MRDFIKQVPPRSFAATSGVYLGPMQCQERQRFVASILRLLSNAMAGIAIANTRSEAWREATKETQKTARMHWLLSTGIGKSTGDRCVNLAHSPSPGGESLT